MVVAVVVVQVDRFLEAAWANKYKIFVTKNVKYLLIPYEGQPFQNQLFKETKKINPKIKTIGYVHSSPLSMPFNLIKKKTTPDVLIVNGKSQYNCLTTSLGWNKKIVRILPSMRFVKGKNNMKKSIYLPLAFKSKDKIIFLIKTLLDETKLNIANFKIKNGTSGSTMDESARKYLKQELQLALLVTLFRCHFQARGALFLVSDIVGIDIGCKRMRQLMRVIPVGL